MCNHTRNEGLVQLIYRWAVSPFASNEQVSIVRQYVLVVRNDTRIDNYVTEKFRDKYLKMESFNVIEAVISFLVHAA